ncbi:App1 family protein [Fuerstiella marisgermanici]|uniref:Phosphatidate phosphatase APP1 catalytic domain-containing protein n=1 Tax=Fuerstiella marisgermanici TaxID=1891926 RepID=A0A1P8WCM1_9PLAN|nr:phosphatase domain-containing protein [Fuerstiella marisgermanici]APZ91810.1 hypothetical protein Fuma_01404 [Fuerstiella marisgermanici]
MSSRSTWREELKQALTEVVSCADDFVDIRWRSLRHRFGWDGIPKIQPYIGYADSTTVRLHGRVLTNPPAELPGENDRWWQNLANTYQRFESDEVPDCEVEIRLGEITHRTVTDAEGYFFVEEPHEFTDTSRGLWSKATIQIVNHPRVSSDASLVTCRVMTPPRNAKFGVISDVDDTILYTGVTRLLTMAKLTFLGNSRTRLPLAGAASLYHALQGTEKPENSESLNPIFYVSSSPWNLFDLLEDFLELNRIPLGPLLLRDLGFDTNKFLAEGHDHKLDKARNILNQYPDLPFLLFGDSGEDDARLYATAAEEFGEQITAIFIRDVDPDVISDRDESVGASIKRAEAAGVPMHLIRDSIEAAEILHSMQLLDAADVAMVRSATAVDLKRGA